MAATYKAVVKKLDQDGSLTWQGITLYGQVDVGAVYQNHGASSPRTATARNLVWRPIRSAARISG